MTIDISKQIIEKAEEHLTVVLKAADDYAVHRVTEFKRYDHLQKSLETERLEAVNWNEKNELSERIREESKFNPAKYLPEYNFRSSPFFASFQITDDNTQIGCKEYYLGKQSLTLKSKVIVIDWRKAEISKLFYEYEETEDYDEQINGIARTGFLDQKISHVIKKAVLQRIISSTSTYQKIDDVWKEGQKTITTAMLKEENSDHHLTDILNLISAEQFKLITEQKTSGVVYLSGGAGCGKTTVALHRLSCLQFQDSEAKKTTHCLVVMFNKTLKEYVKLCSNDLLDSSTAIETYSSWVLSAVRKYSRDTFQLTTSAGTEFDQLKKSSVLKTAFELHATNNKASNILESLFHFYRDFVLTLPASSKLFSKFQKLSAYYTDKLKKSDFTLNFADLGLILRLYQLTTAKNQTLQSVYRWYDHIVIDEAQDLSEIELDTLYDACTRDKSLTICADEGQKILSFVDYKGFTNFKLGVQGTGISQNNLEISYRSGKKILQLACSILSRDMPQCSADEGEVIYSEQESFNSAVKATGQWLTKVNTSGSLSAVICKTKAEAKKVHTALQQHCALKPFGVIDFSPGMMVTNAHQVKGLEFTNVIIFDPSASKYTQNQYDRNLLYVVITRACKRLFIPYYSKLTKALIANKAVGVE